MLHLAGASMFPPPSGSQVLFLKPYLGKDFVATKTPGMCKPCHGSVSVEVPQGRHSEWKHEGAKHSA